MSNLTNKRLLAVAGLWSIGGVVLALLQRPLQDWLWLWADFLNIAYAIAGIALLAAALWKAWQWRHDSRKVRGFLSAAGVTAVAGIALALTGGYLEARGADALVRFRFSRNHAAYEQIVRTVLADSAKSWADSSILHDGATGLAYEVDSGPPIRVAFPQPGGILDNWWGFIYDPTGQVDTARGWRFDRGSQEFTAPDGILKLFGGDLVACDRFEGAWYICSFT